MRISGGQVADKAGERAIRRPKQKRKPGQQFVRVSETGVVRSVGVEGWKAMEFNGFVQ